MDKVVLSARPVTFADVVAVARDNAPIELDDAVIERTATSRAVVEKLADLPDPVYGISTGFGSLATTHIPQEKREQLQRSLIRSHAAGTGDPVEPEVVRAMMFLRLKTLVSGHTGVRPEVAQALAALLNKGVIPLVPEHGSLGCSGDLAPLAHVASVLTGEGEVIANGATRPALEVLRENGLEPVTLASKEGLSLINGTDGMLGMLVLAMHDLKGLLKVADVAAAMSIEGLLGTDAVFAADLHELRPHPGQTASAENIRRLLANSPIVASHATPEDTRVQDAYSLRCAPQVAGSARDTLRRTERVADRELQAAIDNPVVTSDGRIESNGNFHGAPLAHNLDFLAIVVADLASMSERRTDRFLDANRSYGLPPFLAEDPGVDSGYMIAQYTAAGIVAELKRLAVPASVDSIPSSAMQEDHNSMGWHAGRKLRRAIDGLRRVLAIEVMVAARGIDLRAPLEPGPGTGAAVRAVREVVAGPGPDRLLAPEIEACVELVRAGSLVAAVEDALGELA